MSKLESLKALIDAVRAGYIRISDIYAYLCLDNNKKALKLLKDQAILLIKEIMPKKGSGYIKFGSGDPYNTGRIMQAAALLYPYYESFTEVVPVFDEPCLEVKQKAKGRLRLIVPAMIALRLFRCRELRDIYSRLSEEAEGFRSDFSSLGDKSVDSQVMNSGEEQNG